jgi:hypothetical protein
MIEIADEVVHDRRDGLAGRIRMVESQRVSKLMKRHTVQIHQVPQIGGSSEQQWTTI